MLNMAIAIFVVVLILLDSPRFRQVVRHPIKITTLRSELRSLLWAWYVVGGLLTPALRQANLKACSWGHHYRSQSPCCAWASQRKSCWRLLRATRANLQPPLPSQSTLGLLLRVVRLAAWGCTRARKPPQTPTPQVANVCLLLVSFGEDKEKARKKELHIVFSLWEHAEGGFRS